MTSLQKNEAIELNLPGQKVLTVSVASGNARIQLSGDALLPMSLLMAMRRGKDLQIDLPVSPRLLSAVPTIQDIVSAWVRSFRRVEVQAVPTATPRSSGSRVGAFFSGGVDSQYTLFKNQNDITDLILIHGMDMKLDDLELRGKVSAAASEVASSLGKGLIEIEANLLSVFRGWYSWSHGGILASIAHLLSPELRRVYIPASSDYGTLIPWGSHPLLDPLWSSDSLELIHDGCEANRVQKTALLSGQDVAMRTLRVCTRSIRGYYNCGHCEKCLRTMVNLELCGALDSCTTLPHPLDLREVARRSNLDASSAIYARESLGAAEQQPEHARLARALRTALRRYQVRRIKAGIGRRLRALLGRARAKKQERLESLSQSPTRRG